MKFINKFYLMLISVIIIIIPYSVQGESYIPYKDPGKYINISKQPVPLNIKFPNGNSVVLDVIYLNGRICLPLISAVENMGAELDKSKSEYFKITYNEKTLSIPIKPSDSNRCVMVYRNGVGYISLYSLITPFDTEKNSISIYKKETTMSKEELLENGAKSTAYIRFEDIVADGVDKESVFTTKNLEKLIYMADYMYQKGHKYYIAWIPLYYCPATNCINNISLENNLYNSCFIYSLDYMADHGGYIGLHGFSHQYGNDRSVDGYEWGKNTPYTYKQQQERMINAKIVAARLGYTPEFFEFPHYAATNKQMKMAEYYFNCIYQSYPRKELQNSITYTDSPQGKRIYYIPTPIDYVHNPKDVENTIKRIKNSVDKNYAVSMFFHPALDFNKENAVVISVDENTMTRKWSLSADSALKKIVTNIQNLGYKFTRLNTDGK